MLRIQILVFLLVEVSTEKHCSRFHYEEMTLEKMIKLEIFVQNLKDDIDAIEKTVKDNLKKLENSRLDWDKQGETVKKELEEMKTLADSAITPTVAFYAKSPGGLTLVAPQRIIFGEVVLNEGHGYDASTGRFTAPVAGTYMFTAQFCTPKGDGICFAVMSGNQEIKRGLIDNDANPTCHTLDALTVLNKGEYIWIKCTNGATLPWGNDYWNTFSGFLVHK